MAKIVYNACFGGFGLSREAVHRYAEIKGITLYADEDKFFTNYYLCTPEEYERLLKEEKSHPFDDRSGRYERSNAMYFSPSSIARNDPALVQVVEELGDKASGSYSKLRIEELETGTMYRIDEYDGSETVVTRDADEWSVA